GRRPAPGQRARPAPARVERAGPGWPTWPRATSPRSTVPVPGWRASRSGRNGSASSTSRPASRVASSPGGSADMTTFVLIPGADGRAWYWHRVVPELNARGYDAVAVDLPAGDTVGLAEYTDAVVDAIGERTGLVLVA